MRQTGSGIEDIADHLGHKNINNARVYAGNTDETVHAAATKALAFAAVAGKMSNDEALEMDAGRLYTLDLFEFSSTIRSKCPVAINV
jgi:hypothetical protein